MEIYDRAHLKEFLVALFGQQAQSWYPNEQLFNVTYELIDASGECGEALRYIPEPIAPGRNAFKWLAKEARSKFLKTIAENKEQYVVCLRAAAYRMAHRFHLAAQGV